MSNLGELNQKLEEGEEKARIIARAVLGKAKKAIGF
jgi:tryptophanyl-tRNA synthetase